MVTTRSGRVGCGFANCGGRKVFVCNYLLHSYQPGQPFPREYCPEPWCDAETVGNLLFPFVDIKFQWARNNT